MTAALEHRSESVSLTALVPMLERELTRIIAWWSGNSVDHANGGFWGEIATDGRPIIGADKFLIPTARICWFFSIAAIKSGNERDVEIAVRAYRYLTDHFLDAEYGGVIWAVDAKGNPENIRKQAYAQAFALYAFSAHYRLTGKNKALEQAMDLFYLLEGRFHDSEYQGYFEAFARDWTPIDDVRLSEKDNPAPKTMNTHLHIMEAYSELYRANPTPEVAAALSKLLNLHLDRIYRSDISHLRLFWTQTWDDVSDVISYGHDIEASWLIWEAAELLADDDMLDRARPVVLALADKCLDASGKHGEIYNERHLYDGQIDQTRVWWAQAEAMVGYCNAYEITGDARYARRVEELWKFIQLYILNTDTGEWNWFSTIDTHCKNPYVSGAWKACYHNGRAMIECLNRIQYIKFRGEKH